MLAAVGSEADQDTYETARATAGRDARAHLRLALWCGARGLDAKRQKHLLLAILIDPDHATARGLLGFVCRWGRWQRFAEAAASDGPATALSVARARYLRRWERTPYTAEAQWQLALWCEREGLNPEALAHAAVVARLDPSRAAAWKRLGFTRCGGRWLTDAEAVAERIEREVQAKADRAWRPLITSWSVRLSDRAQRASALRHLAGVTDPRAVPSVWRVLGTGSAAEPSVAVRVLGQIDSTGSSRALAVLAVFGPSAETRRTATETLARRDPRQYADLLVGLLRDPIAYDIQPVGGPGAPGRLAVHEPKQTVERIYAPPPPPNLPIFPGEDLTFDALGLPVVHRHTDTTDLPFAWKSASGVIFPSRCVLPPHVPVSIHLGQMWLENRRSAQSAQQQLLGDAAVVEQGNDRIRAANEHVVRVLNHATGQNLPADRETWASWWTGRTRRPYSRDTDRARPTLTQVVPLNDLPRNVAGLGFDPVEGYYLLASTFGW